MFRILDQLRDRKMHDCDEARVERIIKANAELPKEKALSKEQVEALRKLTSVQGLVLVDGYAGTGKSSVLKEAMACWRGYDVIGTAISGKAAEGLEKATGIKSYTLAKLIGAPEFDFRGDLEKGPFDTLKHHLWMLGRAAQKKPTWKAAPRIRLGPRSIVVLDEAGMVSTPELLKLAAACRAPAPNWCWWGMPSSLGRWAAAALFAKPANAMAA